MITQILFRGTLLLLVTIFGGRSFGCRIDQERKASEGVPVLVEVSDSWRPFFRFKWESGHSVVRCALWTEILAYITGIIIILALAIAGVFPKTAGIILTGIEILFVVYLITSLVLVLPDSVSSAKSEACAYDLDWIANIQHNLGMLKKRRCKVLRQIMPGIYEIQCGRIIRCIHRATARIPVEIGGKYYAVHEYDRSPCCWEIRDH